MRTGLNYEPLGGYVDISGPSADDAIEEINYWMEKAQDHYSNWEWAESRAASMIAANWLAVLNVSK